MANIDLLAFLQSVQGKLTRGESVCFRKTPSGGNSVYVQKEHSRESLHSPAQERHRALMAAASLSASAILHDAANAALLEQYRAAYRRHNDSHPRKPFSSLQRYIVHCRYLELKG